jgi:hypothetical protein
VISLNLVLAGLRLGLKNRQEGKKWASDDCCDVTPEATHSVCERIFDGFAQQMRTVSLRTVPTAILSRQTAGTRGNVEKL